MGIRYSIRKTIADYRFGSLAENIAFLHIPKCGGSSLDRAIRDRYPESARFGLVHINARSTALTANEVHGLNYPYDTSEDTYVFDLYESLLLYYMTKPDTRFVSGHFAMSEKAWAAHHDRFSFITFLREPVSRWISAYFFNRYKDTHRKIEMSVEEYLDSDFGRSQGYEYVKYLGGAEKGRDYRSLESIERAKRNLDRFAVAGTHDHQEAFLRLFQKQFGVQLQIKMINRGPVDHSKRDAVITPAIRERIVELSGPDIALYEHFLDRFIRSAG